MTKRLLAGLLVCAGLATMSACDGNDIYNITKGQKCCSASVTTSTSTTTMPVTTSSTVATTTTDANNGVYVCRMEPSQTPEGYEIIAYPVGTAVTGAGFDIPCPNK